MAKGIPLMGRDPDGKAKMINVDENGNVKVQQSGTIQGLFLERPTPSAANKGMTYWAIDTGEVAVSTGTSWRILGVV